MISNENKLCFSRSFGRMVFRTTVIFLFNLFCFSANAQIPYLHLEHIDKGYRLHERNFYVGEDVKYFTKNDSTIRKGEIISVNSSDSTIIIGYEFSVENEIIKWNQLAMLAPRNWWKPIVIVVAIPVFIVATIWSGVGAIFILQGLVQGDALYFFGGLILDYFIPSSVAKFALACIFWPQQHYFIGNEWTMKVQYK